MVTAQRLAAQGLSGPPATGVSDVVTRLLAVQAQDPRGMRLAVRARSTGLTASDVEAALADRSLVVSWLNRGTLHLVRSVDYWWLQALTTPPLATGNARRLAQEGVSPAQAERGVEVVVAALAEGPLGRSVLRDRVAAAGVPTAGQALVHVLMLASLRGLVVRGPMVGAEHGFVLVRQWLGAPPAVDRDEALGWLARRYLAGHGPASDRDLARWAGLPLRDARRGLAELDAVDAGDGLVDVARDGDVPALPPPRLLGAFDPVLLGWTSREPILGRHTSLVTVNGLFRPFAMVGGRAVGTWSLAGGRVSLDLFDRVSKADRAALDADAADVLRFLSGS